MISNSICINNYSFLRNSYKTAKSSSACYYSAVKNNSIFIKDFFTYYKPYNLYLKYDGENEASKFSVLFKKYKIEIEDFLLSS